MSFERVFEVIDLPIEVKNAEDGLFLDYIEGDIKFQNISFSYAKVPEGVRVGLEEHKRYGQQFRTGGSPALPSITNDAIKYHIVACF